MHCVPKKSSTFSTVTWKPINRFTD